MNALKTLITKSPFVTQPSAPQRIILSELSPGWDAPIVESEESDAAKIDNRNKLKELIMHGIACGKKTQAGITTTDLSEFRKRNPAGTQQDGTPYLDEKVYYVLERDVDCYLVHFLMPIYYENTASHYDLYCSVASSRILKPFITSGFDFELCRPYCTVRLFHDAYDYDLRIIVMENVSRVQSNFNHMANTAEANGIHLGLSYGNPKNKKQALSSPTSGMVGNNSGGGGGGGNPMLNEGLNVRKTSNGIVISNVNSPRNKKGGNTFF
jgi:hypothetical protein